VEKISLGKAHGVPSWLKEGYTSLVADLTNTSLPDISALGWEAAFRIAWAHIQATDERLRGGLDPTNIFCARCNITSSRRSPLASITSVCSSCRCVANAWSDGTLANIAIPVSVTFPTEMSTEKVTQKVLEVFEDELKDAELRNTQ
jgi:hypothetical protein